jgi:colanic acid/amylovoran biosynthesis glycosyltransferase
VTSVAIFRKRLLSYSETLIADQGRFLPSYRPLFCGFHRDASGLQLLEGADTLLLDDHSHLSGLSKLMLRYGLGGGKRWLAAIAHENPALNHAHFFTDGIDAVKIARQLHIPVVTTVHGHDITKHENAQAGQSVNRQFFQQVDRVIAASNFIAEQALDKGCPEHKLRTY